MFGPPSIHKGTIHLFCGSSTRAIRQGLETSIPRPFVGLSPNHRPSNPSLAMRSIQSLAHSGITAMFGDRLKSRGRFRDNAILQFHTTILMSHVALALWTLRRVYMRSDQHAGTKTNISGNPARLTMHCQDFAWIRIAYRSFAYSASASLKIGMLESESFHSAKKS